MRALLDTHALLWWLFDDPRLSEKVRGILADRGNGIFVSSASAWELSTKHRLGKIPSAAVLVQDIAGWVERSGFRELTVTIAHGQRAFRRVAPASPRSLRPESSLVRVLPSSGPDGCR